MDYEATRGTAPLGQGADIFVGMVRRFVLDHQRDQLSWQVAEETERDLAEAIRLGSNPENIHDFVRAFRLLLRPGIDGCLSLSADWDANKAYVHELWTRREVERELDAETSAHVDANRIIEAARRGRPRT